MMQNIYFFVMCMRVSSNKFHNNFFLKETKNKTKGFRHQHKKGFRGALKTQTTNQHSFLGGLLHMNENIPKGQKVLIDLNQRYFGLTRHVKKTKVLLVGSIKVNEHVGKVKIS